MGQNEFELVGHGSIGLLQAQFKKNAQGLSPLHQDTLFENFHKNPRGRDFELDHLAKNHSALAAP